MWLLNAKTGVLESFANEVDVPGGYAILSHTWLDQELSFDEILSGNGRWKKGHRKIGFACAQAVRDGYDYVWVDTCCIDKKSSAELSEAINSMFRWYRNAAVCYAFPTDFSCESIQHTSVQLQFGAARWWTRGWTLQELIAPEEVLFYDFEWRLYGSKADLADVIHVITRIDVEVLKDASKLSSTSVAKRMSWTARRSVSREEDHAYSLLGLFDVSMPMLYGEGGVKAFHRLQEEIIRTSTSPDHSILAWMTWEGTPTGLLATTFCGYYVQSQYQPLLSPSPYGFRNAHNIVSWALPQPEGFSLTSQGLRIRVFGETQETTNRGIRILQVALKCRYDNRALPVIVLDLEERPRVDDGLYKRVGENSGSINDRTHESRISGPLLPTISASELSNYGPMALTMAKEPYSWPAFQNFVHVFAKDFCYLESFPPYSFNPARSTLSLQPSSRMFNSRMSPLHGVLVLQDSHLSDGKADEQLVLSIDQVSNENESKSPMLSVDVFARKEIQDLGDIAVCQGYNLVPGASHRFDVPETKLRQVFLSARCVNEAGEFFWSIDVIYPHPPHGQ